MKNSSLKICRLLASSGYSEQEIRDFVFELFDLGPNMAVEHIFNIWQESKTSPFNKVFDYSINNTNPFTKNIVANYENSTAQKIKRLLLIDAGLSIADASKLLTEELNKKFPNINIPTISKKSFYIWIEKLIFIVPEKDLLYIATSIRNRSVHDSPIDWKLK